MLLSEPAPPFPEYKIEKLLNVLVGVWKWRCGVTWENEARHKAGEHFGISIF
jgi:hypothetical protein